jgi:hypothetical protein
MGDDTLLFRFRIRGGVYFFFMLICDNQRLYVLDESNVSEISDAALEFRSFFIQRLCSYASIHSYSWL